MSAIKTYGDFQVEFLHDEKGEKLWSNSLFLNIYDFWCIRRDGFLLRTYKAKNSLLKRIIRKKMRGNNELPNYKVLLRKCIVGEEQFNPMDYLNGDHEQYFHVFKEWKKKLSKRLFRRASFLREGKRHKKICICK